MLSLKFLGVTENFLECVPVFHIGFRFFSDSVWRRKAHSGRSVIFLYWFVLALGIVHILIQGLPLGAVGQGHLWGLDPDLDLEVTPDLEGLGRQ